MTCPQKLVHLSGYNTAKGRLKKGALCLERNTVRSRLFRFFAKPRLSSPRDVPSKNSVESFKITPFTYYRWRKRYGGLKMDQAKKLKDLEKKTPRLKKVVADLVLDKAILKELAQGNF